MNDFIPEFLSSNALLGTGCGLLVFGAVAWKLPNILKETFALRDSHAKRLREAGEEERARKIDAETAVLLHRIPLYGRALVIAGIVVLAVGAIRLK